MATAYEGITNEEQWLKARLSGIGASEASAVVGCNPYVSNVDLWKLKTGRKTAPDISDKQCVQYGHSAEEYIRNLFALDYPKYKVDYGGAFDMVCNPKHNFIFATLDGRLTEIGSGRKGILEIKTTEILRSMQREKWKDRIPDNYFVQVLHQLIATGFDFAVLHAQLKRNYDGDVITERRSYFIERSEVKDNIDFLEEAEISFWNDYVMKDREPNLILPEI